MLDVSCLQSVYKQRNAINLIKMSKKQYVSLIVLVAYGIAPRILNNGHVKDIVLKVSLYLILSFP